MKIKRRCLNCGKEFFTKSSLVKSGKRGKYCSRKCFFEHHRGNKVYNWKGGKIKKICKNCGKEFGIKPCQEKYGEGKYCSFNCRVEYKRKIKLQNIKEKEERKKLREEKRILKEKIKKEKRIKKFLLKMIEIEKKLKKHNKDIELKIVKCDNCGKEIQISSYKFKTHRRHFCNSKCYAKWKKKNSIGKLNNNWKGGVKSSENDKIRRSDEYKIWIKNVLKKDGYKCLICDNKKNLQIHHIIPLSELIKKKEKSEYFNVMNGTTVCYKCHSLLHNRPIRNIQRRPF